jgi:hypothetical protein
LYYLRGHLSFLALLICQILLSSSEVLRHLLNQLIGKEYIMHGNCQLIILGFFWLFDRLFYNA